MENHLRVDSGERRKHETKNTIFVGNLHYDTTDDELRAFFTECGPITKVRVIRDRF